MAQCGYADVWWAFLLFGLVISPVWLLVCDSGVSKPRDAYRMLLVGSFHLRDFQGSHRNSASCPPPICLVCSLNEICAMDSSKFNISKDKNKPCLWGRGAAFYVAPKHTVCTALNDLHDSAFQSVSNWVNAHLVNCYGLFTEKASK